MFLEVRRLREGGLFPARTLPSRRGSPALRLISIHYGQAQRLLFKEGSMDSSVTPTSPSEMAILVAGLLIMLFGVYKVYRERGRPGLLILN